MGWLRWPRWFRWFRRKADSHTREFHPGTYQVSGAVHLDGADPVRFNRYVQADIESDLDAASQALMGEATSVAFRKRGSRAS